MDFRNGFQKGQVDNTLFIKTPKNNILMVQFYDDDIIFGLTNAFLFQELSETMQAGFELSMMGELKFFFGIQIGQWKEGVYVH